MTGNSTFLYEKTEQGICIYACRSLDGIALIPEKIENLPVTELAPYAFSQRRINYPEGRWTDTGEESFVNVREIPLLSGERLVGIVLPSSMEKIGNYAFYNCFNLKQITCHSTMLDLGSGMFTGCNRMKQVDITMHDHQKSCMKELLSEIRERLVVWYHSGGETARLAFPEFYEEDVENTPARILSTRTHGSGHRYRYCFVGTEFQFKEYDAVFGYAKARETLKQLIELALGRLFYPLHLSSEAKEEYLVYIREHWGEATKLIMEQKNLPELTKLMEMIEPDEEQTDEMLKAAGLAGYAEAISYLLPYRQRHFKITRKQFTL